MSQDAAYNLRGGWRRCMGYGAVRFGLGFFRQETVLLWGLQEAQIVAVATAFAALSMLFIRLRAST